jgi:hypothetical protein
MRSATACCDKPSWQWRRCWPAGPICRPMPAWDPAPQQQVRDEPTRQRAFERLRRHPSLSGCSSAMS